MITELLTILSKYDSRTFEAARNKGGISENLRTALHALAREARKLPSSSPQASPVPAEPSVPRLEISVDLPHAEYVRVLTDLFMVTPQFSERRRLLALAKRIKVPNFVDKRYSRERLAAKLANAIAKQKRLRLRLNEALAASGQTSGYFDVILDS